MTDEGFERRLEAGLRRQVDPVQDPEVRLPDLRRVGDRELARRRGLVAAAVATAAVLVVAVVPLAGDRLLPRSVDPVGPASPGRHGVAELVEVTTGPPVVSADGLRVAWVEPDGGGDRVVLADTGSGQRIATRVVPSPVRGSLLPVGVDARSRVFLQDTRGGGVSMWTPGSDLVPVTGLGGVPAEHPWPGGMATVPTIEDTGDDATLYEVSGDGVATEAGTAPRYGTWSIGGRLVAYAEWDSNGGLLPGFGPELLLRGRSGRPTALTPPSDAPAAGDVTGVLPVGWETDDRFAAVVLYDEGRGLRQAVWHCDADPLRCETVVDDLPPAPETGWPDLPVKP